ncbi:MAG: phosphoglycolate phosphatase [Acidobacteria bacterium]|nr:phosphoglycolate phosphatase [Acidobacteriota bacterium]
MRRPRLILFDLDGTLLDSAPDLAHCVNVMLAHFGHPSCSEDDVRTWVGNGTARLVGRALTGRLDGDPGAEVVAEALPVFMAAYAEHTLVHSVLYPGARECLAALADAGFPLGCITNKAARFTEPVLRQLGLLDAFGLVLSGDSLPEMKPHPMPLLHAAAHFGVLPADSLLVGDSVTDVQAARAAGFGIICMSYGYNHGRDIREAKPDAVLDSLAALPVLLAAAPLND